MVHYCKLVSSHKPVTIIKTNVTRNYKTSFLCLDLFCLAP